MGDGAHTTLVSLRAVDKHFGGQHALKDVSIDISPAKVHALVGENGAGKSTLGRIVAGSLAPSSGLMEVDGNAVHYRAPAVALKDGITMIAQEIALAEDLTVYENVLLGFEATRLGGLSRRRMRKEFDSLLDRTGFDLPSTAKVAELPLSRKQEVEILRALARKARLIVMDEPTAALSPADTKKLHGYVRGLREEGVAIVYVSHFLGDVLALADEITILRNGAVVETLDRAEATEERLIMGMLGKKLDAVFPDKLRVASGRPPVLRVSDFQATPRHSPTSFELAPGEIIGIFGLMGAGRSSLAHALSGSQPPTAGSVELEGKSFSPRSPAAAIAKGLVLLPESRRDQGLFLTRSQRDNVSAASLDRYVTAGVTRPRALRRDVLRMLEEVRVDPIRMDHEVGRLSGGNQQKVLFAKCLLCRPQVLILDEPTRGVDIGSKQGIYQLIADLAKAGTGIIVISSELDEVTQLAHRVLVMREGTVRAEYVDEGIDPDRVLTSAFGVDVDNTATQEGVK